MKSRLGKILYRLLNQKGNVTVIMCAAMVALIGVASIGVDAGAMYLTRIRLSNAIDASVLAGVKELPGRPSTAVDVAHQYAQINHLQSGEASFQVSGDSRTLTGTSNRTMNLFFARIFGIDSQLINATATARIAPLSGSRNVVPFGVSDDNYTFGDTKILKFGSSFDTSLPPGQYAPLGLGGSGASVYEFNIINGYNNIINIGDVLPVETGVMSGPTKKGIDYRIGSCPHDPPCTIYHYVNGCPRVLIVPLGTNSPSPGSNGSFTVTGFAAFLVADTPGNGSGNDVVGTFIQYVGAGEGDETAEDRGIYAAKLVE